MEVDPDDEPMRLTFDAGGGFDESQVARRTDIEFFGEPRPDRLRVIVIPDGSTDDPYAPDLTEAPDT